MVNIKSFHSLNKAELLSAAERFGVDADESNTKKEIIESISAAGIKWSDCEDESTNDETAEDAEVDETDADEAEGDEADDDDSDDTAPVDEEQILIKMERHNGTYQVGKYVFTKAHPFKSLPVSEAEALMNEHEGFRPARPSEVTDYYN